MIAIPGLTGSQIPNRQVALQITLANNTQTNQPTFFNETQSSQLNTLNIQGLRVSARIRNAGNLTAVAQVKVWGLTPSLMAQLSSLGLMYNLIPRNIITILAGDPNSGGMSIVFQGTIMHAYGDYENQPDTPFLMDAAFFGAFNVIAAKPTSYPSQFAVTAALQTLAPKMGLSFAGNNVNVMLPPMYVSGSPLVQARKLARAANIDIGTVESTLEATNKAGARQGAPITISPQTGSISYPSFTESGVMIKTLFNPQIKFKSQVQIQSSVLSAIANAHPSSTLAAAGSFPTTWIAQKLDLDLDAQVPGGQWMTTVYAYSPQAVASGFIPPA